MDKSKLIDFLGDYPNVRIMDFLLKHPKNNHTLQQIIEGANVDQPDAYSFMEKLARDNCYVIRNLSEFHYEYRLNLDNPLVEQFLEIDWGNNNSGSCEEKDSTTLTS